MYKPGPTEDVPIPQIVFVPLSDQFDLSLKRSDVGISSKIDCNVLELSESLWTPVTQPEEAVTQIVYFNWLWNPLRFSIPNTQNKLVLQTPPLTKINLKKKLEMGFASQCCTAVGLKVFAHLWL